MKSSIFLRFGILACTCLIWFFACASPGTDLFRNSIRLQQEGNLEGAFSVIQEAFNKFPNDQRIKRTYEEMRKELIKRYYLEANSIDNYNLPAKIAVLQRISKIDPQQTSLLTQLSNEMDSLNQRANRASDENDSISFIDKFLFLRKYEPYFDSVKQLKTRLVNYKPNIILKIAEFQKYGGDDQAILISYAASNIFPDSMEFVTIKEDLLSKKAAKAISLATQYSALKTHDRSATSLVYLIIARSICQTTSSIKPLIQKGLNDFVLFNRKNAVVDLSSNFSDKQKDDLISYLREYNANPLIMDFIKAEAASWPIDIRAICELDLEDLSMDENHTPSTLYSKYQAGYQAVPNTRYDSLTVELATAVFNYKEAMAKLEQLQAEAKYSGAWVAVGIQQGLCNLLQIKANNIAKELAQTPKFIQQEVYDDYQYERIDFNYHLNGKISYRLIDPLTQAVLKKDTFENTHDERSFTISGAHPRDVNGIKDVRRDQNESKEILKNYRDAFFGDLAKRLIHDLSLTIPLAEVQYAINNKNYGEAAEKLFSYRLSESLQTPVNSFADIGDEYIDRLSSNLNVKSMAEDLGRLLEDPNYFKADLSLSRVYMDSFRSGAFLSEEFSDFKDVFASLNPEKVEYTRVAPPKLSESIKRKRPQAAQGSKEGIGNQTREKNIIEESLSSVVVAETVKAAGSGFIISPQGFIITNYHVISGQENIKVRLSDGNRVEADIVSLVKFKDLALIKVNQPNLVPIKLGDPKKIRVGDTVYALGAPVGFQQTVTKGIVSAIRLLPAPYNALENIQFIQTDAAINPGNSGGPLINQKGEVIGVNNQKIVGKGVEGINFAISIEEVLKSFSEYLR